MGCVCLGRKNFIVNRDKHQNKIMKYSLKFKKNYFYTLNFEALINICDFLPYKDLIESKKLNKLFRNISKMQNILNKFYRNKKLMSHVLNNNTINTEKIIVHNPQSLNYSTYANDKRLSAGSFEELRLKDNLKYSNSAQVKHFKNFTIGNNHWRFRNNNNSDILTEDIKPESYTDDYSNTTKEINLTMTQQIVMNNSKHNPLTETISDNKTPSFQLTSGFETNRDFINNESTMQKNSNNSLFYKENPNPCCELVQFIHKNSGKIN